MSEDRDYVGVALTLTEAIHLMALAAVYGKDDAVISSACQELSDAANEYAAEHPQEAHDVARQILLSRLFDKVDP